MKVLFAFASIGNFPAYERVIRQLCDNGHHVTILHGETTKTYFSDNALVAMKSQYGERLNTGPLMLRGRWRRFVGILRKVINRIPYSDPLHPSPWLVDRNTGFGRFARLILATRPFVALLKNGSFKIFIKRLERSVAADTGIKSWLCQSRPDVVIGSPCIYSIQHEVEYLKAASELKIPTAIAIFSWDHLLSKGTIHFLSDWLFVWNKNMARDAVALHSVSANRVFLTGAPHFDEWFERGPALDYPEFCKKIGLSSEKKYVSYMCSAVNRDESRLVAELADALSSDASTEDVSLLVRPYPSKSQIWKDFKKKNVVIWPKTGSIPNSSDEKDDYYHAMFYGVAVAGVSTTAFVEAGIVGRPCIALAVEEYQFEHRMGHFGYLLEADFMELAAGPDEFVEISKNLICGHDIKIKKRERFTKQFVRPQGENRSASEVMANAIQLLAQNGDLSKLCD
jgi:hypothetical protein